MVVDVTGFLLLSTWCREDKEISDVNYFAAPPANSTAHWLKEELRRAIVEMEIAPGARLSEQEIAVRYAVSRQPVREALISLANLNLVEIRPQRGTYVSLLSLSRMREARLLREAVELAIIKQACKAFDMTLVPEIEANLDQQTLHAKYGDRQAFQSVDAQFHNLLARGGGFVHAMETLNGLKLHTDRICKLTLTGPDVLSRLVDQHRGIFAAVLNRQEPLATELMHKHLSDILSFLPTVQMQNPEWFHQEKDAQKLNAAPAQKLALPPRKVSQG
jgi:GntR family transcriptional regulator, rspAB operon transcriptional repressor